MTVLPSQHTVSLASPSALRPALYTRGWIRSSQGMDTTTNRPSVSVLPEPSRIITPLQTQIPTAAAAAAAVQSVQSAHPVDWGSEPGSAVDERKANMNEPRPSGDGAPLPSFLRQTRSEIQSKFIDLEWSQRSRMNGGQWTRLQNAETIRRNRYANVDPYDKNRVRLRVPNGHCDYINASAIQLITSKSKTEKNFIATQGPKADSYSHIWRMVWDETADVAVIIMLTQTHEMSKEKCFQYFPLDFTSPVMRVNETDEFGDGITALLILKSSREDAATRSIIRELELRKSDGQIKTVYHLLFAGWPDFLIPEGSDRTALVNLIRFSRTLVSNNVLNPRIVHCSAGVGRTGTFIALDWLLDEVDEGTLDNVRDGTDPIADVVDSLREQRMMMVQGEAQFSFLYDVVREAWVERWKSRSRKL